MAKTVEFYRDVLGMPLVKTLDLPDGSSQHFFFDRGGGNSLAFFWFANAPEAAPGIAAPTALPSWRLPQETTRPPHLRCCAWWWPPVISVQG